jgi:hypothetical protein
VRLSARRPGCYPGAVQAAQAAPSRFLDTLVARTFFVEVERGDVDLLKLYEFQRQAARLPHALAGYISWLTPQLATLPATLRTTFEGLRGQAVTDGQHLRVPEGLAHLWIGFDCMLAYAEELKACDPTQAQSLRDEGWGALVGIGRRQARMVESERPSRRFLSVLLALVTSGKAVVLPRDQVDAYLRVGEEKVGWADESALYLIPEVAFTAVPKACRESGEPFPVRERRLKKDLQREGLSDCEPDRLDTTAKIGRTTKRVLKLHREAVRNFLGEVTGFAQER